MNQNQFNQLIQIKITAHKYVSIAHKTKNFDINNNTNLSYLLFTMIYSLFAEIYCNTLYGIE